eukprot:2006879-Rhodomonas_salina.1
MLFETAERDGATLNDSGKDNFEAVSPVLTSSKCSADNAQDGNFARSSSLTRQCICYYPRAAFIGPPSAISRLIRAGNGLESAPTPVVAIGTWTYLKWTYGGGVKPRLQ